jgi:hypothetical protein
LHHFPHVSIIQKHVLFYEKKYPAEIGTAEVGWVGGFSTQHLVIHQEFHFIGFAITNS